MIGDATLRCGDCLDEIKKLPDRSVQCCVTSPPYFGLRDYGVDGQIGLEATPDEYVARMVAVFREVRRVLNDDGTLWLNLGDSYNAGRNGGHAGGKKQASLERHNGIERSGANVPDLKPKDLIGIPWRVAFALQSDGWWLRQDIIWHKPNPMPESVTDRCTKSHEYLFLLAKSERYHYDADAIKEISVKGNANSEFTKGKTAIYMLNRASNAERSDDGKRNRRSVWTVATKPCAEAHFAVMPEALVEPCVLAGSRPGDTVLDPFNGSGTTGIVAVRHGRHYVGIDLNRDYLKISERRLSAEQRQDRMEFA